MVRSLQLALLPVLLLCCFSLGQDTDQQQQLTVMKLAQQVMMQQLFMEERIRSDGDSGIKEVRLRRDGTKPYQVTSYSDKAMAALHDHSDHHGTVGLGELVAVLNGVEFRTRHNDYLLKQPSTTSSGYHATEDVPYPDVPPEVTSQPDLSSQIAEMREWFKAWRDSNHTVRDYRKYFKPLLCYMEGAWTTDLNDVPVDEPFDSDRHHVDADSWRDLHQRIRFTSYTGEKSNLENLAFLPSTILDFAEDGTPVLGQWNYRILCHPIPDHLNFTLADLALVESLSNRLSFRRSYDGYLRSRAARFTISSHQHDQEHKWTLLDRIMATIPGMDNYQANITDDTFGLWKHDVFDNRLLNTGYYHRWYKQEKAGAMGDTSHHRGYNDRNLWVAETTQSRVAPVSYKHCLFPNNAKKRTCTIKRKRMSYAIPLEVVYLTPLNAWNPYDIEYKGYFKDDPGLTVKVGENGAARTGSTKNPDKAFNGTNSKAYYRTPVGFFQGEEVDKDSADTTRRRVGVLDKNGQLRIVTSSGIRIILPEIDGVGALRIRFPVMPVHAEGSTCWKELEALRDVVMDMGHYMKYFQTPPPFAEAYAPKRASSSTSNGAATAGQTQSAVLRLEPSTPLLNDSHVHFISVNKNQLDRLIKKRKTKKFITTEANGHVHEVTVAYDGNPPAFRVVACNKTETCTGHASVLTQVSD